MLKPFIATLAIATIGAGGVAWAHTAEERTARRDALRMCADQVDRSDREAMAECLAVAGFPTREITPEQQAKRDAARECIKAAREAHAGDRPGAIEAARACLADAGFEHPDNALRGIHHRGQHLRARRCLNVARQEHEGDRDAIREAVRECLQRPAEGS